jgi:hypothetical protein
MIEFIQLSDNTINKWENIVSSFSQIDVYYLPRYVQSFVIHGDGEAVLIYYTHGSNRIINVAIKKDIANYPQFQGLLAKDQWYELSTPYGYGGFICDENVGSEEIDLFWVEYQQACKDQRIIFEFFRFHPLLINASFLGKRLDYLINLGPTIAMELTSPEVIWENIVSKNRNMIRKAQKTGIKIKHGQSLDLFSHFQEIYNKTMDRDNAKSYYYFKEPFYQSIAEGLQNNYQMFYAELDDKIIAMSIILLGKNYIHYHLSGSEEEYRKFAPSNLLLYEAALWGCSQGYRFFHLGGGVGASETDGLYKFKAAFNRNSSCRFYIGGHVYNQSVSSDLIAVRQKNDPKFDINNNYFPRYRG